jgi:hypothetical protein
MPYGVQDLVNMFQNGGLTDAQKYGLFNTVSQGNNWGESMQKGGMGGVLDSALRQSMGPAQFQNWLQHMDTQMGSGGGMFDPTKAGGIPGWDPGKWAGTAGQFQSDLDAWNSTGNFPGSTGTHQQAGNSWGATGQGQNLADSMRGLLGNKMKMKPDGTPDYQAMNSVDFFNTLDEPTRRAWVGQQFGKQMTSALSGGTGGAPTPRTGEAPPGRAPPGTTPNPTQPPGQSQRPPGSGTQPQPFNIGDIIAQYIKAVGPYQRKPRAPNGTPEFPGGGGGGGPPGTGGPPGGGGGAPPPGSGWNGPPNPNTYTGLPMRSFDPSYLINAMRQHFKGGPTKGDAYQVPQAPQPGSGNNMMQWNQIFRRG